ncbi:MAG: hypothetical protein COU47_02655 [Candidatus Niyogibacteria bacterium CG10_big_fil_rev_8_21_14_0_10_46_36]|uniref:Uncharacterized protein n=1 Tax=Candidatus Niyogibacteria bacterium CG10_big_fil_rev_8_21_14_0_10_46_36 TaxID=1974726 RepID=A0A2H0TF64_9BACT|nr:MAG: hypothetical protein COU47_02655 [Candidatus Niyogibacteria bacterium CG10_big_fil_rev_8_21_14_0_10_46_36]
MSSIAATILLFAFITALLLWILVGVHGKWLIKALLIVAILPAGLFIWNSIESSQGWSTPKEPPNKFLFLSSVVQQPDKKTGFKGAIFIWLTEYSDGTEAPEEPSFFSQIMSLFTYRPANEPRAHKLPYSKQLEEQVGEAMERQRHGIPTVVEHNKGKADGNSNKDGNDTGEDGMPSNENSEGSYSDYEQEFMFYPLPPPKFPPKIPAL